MARTGLLTKLCYIEGTTLPKHPLVERQNGMKSATELFHVPLAHKQFVIGDITVPLQPGLLSTVTFIQKNIEPKTLKLLGPRLGAVSRNTDKILKLLVAYAQLEWYTAKGSTSPESVVETYNKAVQEAAVSDAPQTSEGGATDATTPEVKKERAGTRPYCRSLIEAGETNEQTLLAAVHAKFPEKSGVFKVADVRGQLRIAGKLDWTKRKGAKKEVAQAATETPAS